MWWRGPTSALYGRSEPQLTYLQTMGLDDPKTSSLVLGHPPSEAAPSPSELEVGDLSALGPGGFDSFS